ncbi:hypothetical protein [Vitiosangium sp. GDMCC 1.1324]|uniref:hypothetical protein n=1 Tax=Vitiosangium sp. (strain GDMCC 1.1324) TaxID=2138576 RepID=UPI0011B65501|nr:hypothetical protein [Vitiosangium sp. GDMCC 1.1324]
MLLEQAFLCSQGTQPSLHTLELLTQGGGSALELGLRTRPAEDVQRVLEGGRGSCSTAVARWLEAMSRAGYERGSAQEESAANSRFHSCGSSSSRRE